MTAGDEHKAATILLEELEGESAAYPHASALAADLRLILNRAQSCLIVWEENGTCELWSLKLEQGGEMNALIEAHGHVMCDDDPAIEVLQEAIRQRGRRVVERTEGMWMVAHVTVL